LRQNFSQRTHQIHSIGPKIDVFGRFEPFRFCTKVDAKLAKLVPLTQKFAKRSDIGKFHNESTWSTNFDPKLSYCMIVDAKLAELAQIARKFAKGSYVGKFRNERSCSTQLVPKLMF
jgi:hypothetical protein